MADLAEGRVVAELQIGAWPPSATQMLLSKSDGQLSLTVRGKPSGRLRVVLERAGFEPIVVRTMHLRLRAPTVLKVQIAWRGSEAVVAAAGQMIGSTADFIPEGVVSQPEIDRSAPPVDHVDNQRMRELRRKQVSAVVTNSMSAGVVAERYLDGLVPAASVLEDLVVLVQQGRRHHMPGLLAALRQLVQGDDHQPALLQFCAGLLDAPLLLHVPASAPAGGDAASLLAAAFDATVSGDVGHGLAVDLDAWLRQEVPWLEATLPVGWLLRQVEIALASPHSARGGSILDGAVVDSPIVLEALCRFAQTICVLARKLAKPIDAADDSVDESAPEATSGEEPLRQVV